MAERDDTKQNTLSRYEKRSPDLALLEYSHCEVPAGCGGAVLRWVDPRAEVPLLLRLDATAPCAVRLDGAPIVSSRVSPAPGPHILAFLLARAESGEAALLFSASPDSAAKDRRVREAVERAAFCSVPGPAWRISAVEPVHDAWMREGFDDAAWSPAEAIALPGAPNASWIRRELLEQGVRAIGLRGARGPLWIRRRFVVAATP